MKTAYIDCTAYGHSILNTHGILKTIPDIEVFVGDPTPGELDRLLDGTTGIINGHTIIDKSVFDRCNALKSIVFLGTGASTYIDLDEAKNRGIEVRTIRGYGDRTIAEHALALMLAASRRIAVMDRELRRGIWHTPVGVELAGKRLGIVGVGGIGAELIKMAAVFGMEVVAWNRSPIDPTLPCLKVELDELFRTSDVVSLHLALNEETRGIVSAEVLEKMKKTAILVNVGRGALVDEKALIHALTTDIIAHAALDVFEHEPLSAAHPLTDLENVTLTAHAAFSSDQAMFRLFSRGFEALKDSMEKMEKCD